MLNADGLSPEASDPTVAGVTGYCEPPNLGVGNQFQGLWKSNTCS